MDQPPDVRQSRRYARCAVTVTFSFKHTTYVLATFVLTSLKRRTAMYRFHHLKDRSGSGKWVRLSRSGVGTVLAESDGTWQILVAHRKTGTTIRRDVYSVTIRCESTRHEEFLPGFSSKTAAVAAAKRRIKILESLRQRREIRQRIKRRSPSGPAS